MYFITITDVHLADDNQKCFFTYCIPQVSSYLNPIYLSGYHFIKMLDRPVDLPLRFIIVCVAKPLTFRREMDISTKLYAIVPQLTFRSNYLQITNYTLNGRISS